MIANHEDLKELVNKFDLPFICVKNDNLSRQDHEKLVLDELSKFKFDYMVLAKYMRILSPNFV